MHIWGGKMEIPNFFKEAINDIFYDKEITIYSNEATVDDEGCIIQNVEVTQKDSFKGNFQFSNREYIQQSYGLEIDANAIVTCNDTVAEFGDTLKYKNNKYIIKGKIPSDSHTTLLVKGDD